MQNNNKWTNELEIIANIIAKLPFDKSIKWGSEVFSYQGKNVVSYGGFKDYFTIWFYNGVFLKDQENLLVNAGEGKTKSLRQWRFASLKEIDERKITAYLLEAIEIEQKGLKIAIEKHQPIETPAILANALQNDNDFKAAFNKLTSGKQKEYSLYINEAKQETTKLSRIEKIKPLVLQGKGLNDKYRK